MKPGLSLARIGVRPMRRPTSVVASSAASPERSVATTSTSFISAGGLKKCMPTTRSGCGTPAAIALTGSEEVLLARIACGPQAPASAANSSALQRQVLGRRLDHEVALGEVAEAAGGIDAPRRRGCLLLAPAAALGPLAERGAEALDAGFQRLRHRVVQERLVAAQRRDLGDPGPHRAGADDADPLDGGHLPSNFGTRFSRKAFIPSTRSSVAIASS